VPSTSSRRVLITGGDEFVGPTAVRRFPAEGDVVMAHLEPLTSRNRTEELVRGNGPFDRPRPRPSAALRTRSLASRWSGRRRSHWSAPWAGRWQDTAYV